MKTKKQKIKKFEKEIKVPEGIDFSVENNEVVMKKDGKEVKRRFAHVILGKKENSVVVEIKGGTRRHKKQINSITAHINNIIGGLQKHYVYKLQICSVHFPMNVTLQGDEVVIKNYLGESRERRAKIVKGVEIKIEKDIITITSPNKEAAGQSAANIEKKAAIKNKDRRVFQDGIFMIEKAGEAI